MVSESLPVPMTPLDEGARLAELEGRVAALELSGDSNRLNHEAQYRNILISEIRQRIVMRYAAVFVAILTMVGMAGLVMHAVHTYFVGPFIVVPQAVAIAMFVGPVASISAVSIMLLIGAFRRFKDDDIDNVNVTALAAEAARSSTGI